MRQVTSPSVFRDRPHAGAVLARELESEVDEDAVVVGLARGGAVLAAVVARVLGLPLDILAVRKVRHRLQPEYALGAVAPGARAYVRARDGLTDRQLAIAVGLARAEADALDRKLRAGRPAPWWAGRTVLLVDDGLATGATMIAAVRWARERGAGRVVAAAPVGARETVTLLRREADQVVCPYPADDFGAVGLWYAEFPQVDDEDVAALLQAGREASPPPTAVRLAPEKTTATVHVIGSAGNITNVQLVRRWTERGLGAFLVSPEKARRTLRPGDIALGRLDVLPTLDGVEPGLLSLLLLERSGVRVLNPAAALLAVHDKLRTARRLHLAGLPHPRTTSVRASPSTAALKPPLVLKPRFGSWGRDVMLCRDQAELESCLGAVSGRSWFRRHGALLQELVPPRGYDLRLIVAGGEVVGGSERVAAAGDWRTNVSLGGTLRAADVPSAARSLARAAAAAVDADLVGVDLLPVDGDRYVVLELNGAVDFDERYALDGRDVYAEAARALGLPLSH